MSYDFCIPMARYPNAIEKTVVLTGEAAVSVAKLFGLACAGSVSLPVQIKAEQAEYNVLTFSPSPEASLSISPHWLDLQTGPPWQPGAYAVYSPLVTAELDTSSPWWLLLQHFKKETPPAQWQKGHSARRCFDFAHNLELCIEVHVWEQQKQGLSMTVRDTAFPTPQQRFAQLHAEAEGGDVEAQYHLAWKYMPMEGGGPIPRPDLAKAAFWFRKAAAQGHAGAQLQLRFLQEADGF